jgi:hypothetical protein
MSPLASTANTGSSNNHFTCAFHWEDNVCRSCCTSYPTSLPSGHHINHPRVRTARQLDSICWHNYMAPIGSWSDDKLLTKGHPLSWQLCCLQPRTLSNTHSRDTRGWLDVLPLCPSRQLHWRFLLQPEQHGSRYGASTKLRNDQGYMAG